MKLNTKEYQEALASLAKSDRDALAAMIIEYVQPE